MKLSFQQVQPELKLKYWLFISKFARLIINTIKVVQTPIYIFFKSSRGLSFSYVIFFSSTLLKKIILWFFMYFLKSNFRTWATKLSLAFYFIVFHVFFKKVIFAHKLPIVKRYTTIMSLFTIEGTKILPLTPHTGVIGTTLKAIINTPPTARRRKQVYILEP